MTVENEDSDPQEQDDVFDIIGADEDTLEDFITGLYESLEHIEHDLFVLESDAYSVNALNAMIRSLKTLQHRCHELLFEPFVTLLLPIEQLALTLIEKKEPCSLLLKEAIFLALDQLKFTAENLIQRGQVKLNTLNDIAEAFCRLELLSPEQRDQDVVPLINSISGLEINSVAPEMAQVEMQSKTSVIESSKAETRRVQASLRAYESGKEDVNTEEDLRFFEVLSRSCDIKMSFWKGRTQKIMQMALGINQILGKPVEEALLKVATFTHDLGMVFIPDHILNKKQKLNAMEEDRVRVHVKIGYELVCRMDAWRAAAEIVIQHHERYDGLGYPANLKGDDIDVGARIMAVCDTFFSITNARPDRSHKRSILRAAKEINLNSGTQFDPAIVQAFNEFLSITYGKRSKSAAA